MQFTPTLRREVGSGVATGAPAPRSITERSTHDLCEQFVLARTLDAPSGWDSQVIAGWTLATHPTLPVVTVDDPHGTPIGWLLGYPITPEAELLVDGGRITMSADPLDLVEELGGRFLAVFAGTEQPRIYPDAAGTYASVYCPSLGIAASTPSLIPYDTTTLDRTELVEQLDIPWTGSMYPVGLTPRHGIHRLLPNHHLDLQRWEMVRHGPRWDPPGTVTVEEAASRIAAVTRRNLAALLGRFPCSLPLTAGRDSRMLLACSRQWSEELELYTVALPGLEAATDCGVAARISRRMGLYHRRIRMRPPDDDDLERWLHRTAGSVGEPRGWAGSTTYRSIDRRRVRLLGNIGDIARRAYVTSGDRADDTITPERLVVHALRHRGTLTPGQARAAASPVVLDQLDRWIQQVGTTDALQILDMFYLENRIGCWAGVWAHAEYYGPGFTIFPTAHRDIVADMMAIPRADRDAGTLFVEVIRQQWPELLAWPFNTAPRGVLVSQFPRRAVGGVRRRVRARIADRRGAGGAP